MVEQTQPSSRRTGICHKALPDAKRRVHPPPGIVLIDPSLTKSGLDQSESVLGVPVRGLGVDASRGLMSLKYQISELNYHHPREYII